MELAVEAASMIWAQSSIINMRPALEYVDIDTPFRRSVDSMKMAASMDCHLRIDRERNFPNASPPPALDC
jgi:hypothetical protein